MFKFTAYVPGHKKPVRGSTYGEAHKRFECPKCHNWVKLRKDGAIRKHRICRLWHTRSLQPECPWSHVVIEVQYGQT